PSLGGRRARGVGQRLGRERTRRPLERSAARRSPARVAAAAVPAVGALAHPAAVQLRPRDRAARRGREHGVARARAALRQPPGAQVVRRRTMRALTKFHALAARAVTGATRLALVVAAAALAPLTTL